VAGKSERWRNQPVLKTSADSRPSRFQVHSEPNALVTRLNDGRDRRTPDQHPTLYKDIKDLTSSKELIKNLKMGTVGKMIEDGLYNRANNTAARLKPLLKNWSRVRELWEKPRPIRNCTTD
jgi:hypothetical protein